VAAIALAGLAAPDSARGRLALNTLWAMAGSAVSQGSALLAALVLGRTLGVTQFGQFALIQATVVVLGSLGEAGLTLTTTKYVSQWRVRDPQRAGSFIGWSLAVTAFLAMVMVLVMSAVATPVARSAGVILSGEFRAGAGLLVFDMLNRVQLGALAGLEAFATSARIQVVRGVLLLPCVYLGARHGGLLGAIAAMSLASLAVFAAGHLLLHRRCAADSIHLGFRQWQQPGHVFKTSAFLWTGGLLVSGSTWLVTVLLSRQPSGLTELGLFHAADKWKTAMLFLPQVLFQVVLPMLSHSHAVKDHRSCERIITAALVAAAVITGSAAVVVYLLAGPWMSTYGPGFAQGANVLTLAAAGAVAIAVYTVGAGILWALGNPNDMLAIDLLRTVVFVILCFTASMTAGNAMLWYLISYAAACAVVAYRVRELLREQREP
jgi:O-antigen/teichoic acid export membrane protein